MPTLAVDDRRVSYEDSGAGPVALLVHGSPGNGRAWARVAERLAGRFRVIAPDLPGYGETTPQPPGQEPAVGFGCDLVESLVQQVGPPAVLAGHSYGGVVALRVALRGRVPVGALVLFEPVAVPALVLADEQDAFAAAKAVFDDYIGRAESGDRVAVRTMIDFWFGADAFARMPEPFTAYMIRETASNVRDVRATFRERYSVDALGKLHVPLTLVVGARSPEVTHRIAHAIVRHVPHASVQTLPGANHALTTTHADAVAEAIAGSAGRG